MASIDVKLNSNYANNDSLKIISDELEKNSIIHEIYYQKDLITKLNNNVKTRRITPTIQLNSRGGLYDPVMKTLNI